MMKELLKQVESVTQDEYDRAARNFGPINNSRHESFAVTYEEFEEALEAGAGFKTAISRFWGATRSNEMPPDLLDDMKQNALHAAAEWIQVAAMCEKAKKTEEEKCGTR